MTDIGAATAVETLGPERLPLREAVRRRFGADAILAAATRGAAVTVLLMLGALVVVLFLAALPSVREFGPGFVTGSDWRPNELEVPKRAADGKIVIEDGEVVKETIPPSFGALPVIYGTAASSLLAVLFAVPLGIGAALYLVRIAPRRLVAPVSFLIEFLAAIPSIAYGVWGLFVLAPFLQRTVEPVLKNGPGAIPFVRDHVPLLRNLPGLASVPGFSWLFGETINVAGVDTARELALTGRDMFCGGLILGIMILPIITAVSRDVLRAVPRAQIEGTLALGATWWQSAKEMLRYGRSGLFGAVMLGLARAAGETMAITMVIGNNSQIKASPFAPAQTMSSLLANEFAEASTELHRSALTEVALILLVMSLAFNVVARSLVVGRGGSAIGAGAH